jgi:hypothetical protein
MGLSRPEVFKISSSGTRYVRMIVDQSKKWRSVPCCPTTRRQTLGACTPVDDFRFLNPVTCPVRWRQTGHLAHGAVDVHGLAADAADQMVVIIAHAIFVASRGPGRLNPSDEPLLGKRPKRVIHSLPRNGSNLGANLHSHFVCRGVRPACQHLQHSHTLGSHLEPTVTQKFSGIMRHTRQSTADSGQSQEVDLCQICAAGPRCLSPISGAWK